MTLRQAARAPVAALAFLTRVPVGRLVDVGDDDVARGAVLFPVVGGLVGGLAGLTADVLAGSMPPLLAGALAVAVAAVATGAMHLDALADTADALGGPTRERALEIMRDHHVGAFGVVALVLVCLVDAAALGALGAADRAAVAGVAAGAAGRAAMLPLAFALPYARAGGGQGRLLAGLSPGALVAGIAIGAALSLPAGWTGLWSLAAGTVVAIALLLFVRRWLGGVTGDVLGAVGKIVETVVLVVAVSVVS
ncbi:MAG TPA: adenosylcobinamide-GDP ribazoletransferase [Gaiella sp.]